jgi:hypothetical protein
MLRSGFFLASSRDEPETVIASEAKQSIGGQEDGLLRRFAPRNDKKNISPRRWVAASG